MKYFYCLILLFMFLNTLDSTIFDFDNTTDISDWKILDDVVMGGKSNGTFKLTKDGYGEFFGHISLENNGGFSSLRYRFPKKDILGYTKVVLLLKGDGKVYQFRVKKNSNDFHSYISKFATNGDWQTITIDLSDMYPAFRGRVLNIDNFSSNFIEQIAFLIGNKKEEDFKLLIDKIYLVR